MASPINRRTLLGLAATAASTPALAAPLAPVALPLPETTEVVPLWPARPPGARGNLRETVTNRISNGRVDRFVTGIGRPRMFVVRPAKPNGAACLICPGGSYIHVVIDKEAFEVAARLAQAGVTSFVLRYRLPTEDWAHPSDVPLQDVQRAVRLIRAGAAGFGIDPHRICTMGFSAGGHVAASSATRFAAQVYAPVDAADRQSARPDLSALMYPVIDMFPPLANRAARTALIGSFPPPWTEATYSLQRHVTPQTPPTFLIHAGDDRAVPTENSLDYLTALRAAKVPAEAHIFEEGGHGFAIRMAQGKPAAAWPDLFLAWAGRHGFMTGASA